MEYFIDPAWLVMPSAFMNGICMDLGSSSRCIFNAHAFFSLMKHMCALLSSRATMVSFFRGCTFQIRVTGISISLIPHALSYEALAFFLSHLIRVSICV